jgi:hypothetical protein
VQYLVYLAEGEETHYVMWHDVHGEGHRAAVGTLLALETGGDAFAAQAFNFISQRRLRDNCL